MQQQGDELFCVVASSQADGRPDKVPIHWGKGTPFTKETVAVCGWLARVHREDVLSTHHILPDRELVEVTEKVRALIQARQRQVGS